jgi:chromosome segregation ATPase
MLTKEDWDQFRKLLHPIKEDLEITRSEVSKIAAEQRLNTFQISDLKEQISSMNEKLNHLDEKTDQLMFYIDNVNNDHETRIQKLEDNLLL